MWRRHDLLAAVLSIDLLEGTGYGRLDNKCHGGETFQPETAQAHHGESELL